jgi:hypothetical protein
MKKKNSYSVDQLAKDKLGEIEQKPKAELWSAISLGVAGLIPASNILNPTQSIFTNLANSFAFQFSALMLFIAVCTTTVYYESAKVMNSLQVATTEIVTEIAEDINLVESGDNKSELKSSIGATIQDTVKLASIEIVKMPSNGTVFYDKVSETFTYEPSKDFYGVDSFKYVRIFTNDTRSAEASVVLKIDPEVILNARFTYENLGGNNLKLKNTSVVSSNDPLINKIETTRWEVSDGRASTRLSPEFAFEQSQEVEVCLIVSVGPLVEEKCKKIMVTEDAFVPSNEVDVKGVSNKPIQIDLNKGEDKNKRSVIIPLEGLLNFNGVKGIGRRITLLNASGGYVDTTGIETSYNSQPKITEKKN